MTDRVKRQLELGGLGPVSHALLTLLAVSALLAPSALLALSTLSAVTRRGASRCAPEPRGS